jgi:hypothetical protein
MDDPSQDFGRETAACLWEAVLNLRDNPGTDPESLTLAMSIRSAFEAVGTAQMRLTVVGWTNTVEAAWAAVQDSYDLCFDWDFVPEWIIDHIDWSEPGNPAIRPRGSGGGERGAWGR